MKKPRSNAPRCNDRRLHPVDLTRVTGGFYSLPQLPGFDDGHYAGVNPEPKFHDNDWRYL